MLAKFAKSGAGVECSSKPAAQRSLFEINWCQAGLAAVKGAAQGVAIGAGSRNFGAGARDELKRLGVSATAGGLGAAF
jgi:hypothetical protein